MADSDDHELLVRYAHDGSETAFGELVRRYVNLVYSTARRLTNNPHHAQDITQAVFIILARKAGSLRHGTIVSGWLYQTTRLTARNFVRGEIRRERREHEAFMQSTLNEPQGPEWDQITPLLDEAMGRLGRVDRDAVVLRFFQNKTSAEVGRALDLSEAAAQKRVSRAVEKLHAIFMKRGVTLSSAAIAGTIAANSVQAAPVTVGSAIAGAGLGKAATAGSVQWAVNETLRQLLWLKMKAALLGVVILSLAGGGVIVAQRQKASRMGTSSSHVIIRVPRDPAAAAALIKAHPDLVAGQALITIKLLGTPGVNWKVSWSGTGEAQTTNGVLPAEVAFSADGYTVTIDAQGSGEFGYEIYRGSLRQAANQVAPISKPRSTTIIAKPGGTGISSRNNPVRPNP
jgi:RNA polymerase sigma factor (sigma-70 family)